MFGPFGNFEDYWLGTAAYDNTQGQRGWLDVELYLRVNRARERDQWSSERQGQERVLREDAVRSAVAATQQETRQLKTTLGALRAELEQARYEAEPRVQDAVANSKEEIAQLRATSAALRAELERVGIVHAQELEDLRTRYRAEAIELQATVRELRERLEGHPTRARGTP